MELDWLKDFLALAKLKSFSRAADSRHVTQPAFSRRIRALEDWVGTSLFIRGAQGASLTEAGTYFQPLAERLTSELDRLRRDTRSIGEGETAALSIAATHALSFTFFPGWIRKLMQEQTLGTINLVSDSMDACEDILLAGEVHFLLCHYHADAGTKFESDRFPSLLVGTDMLVPCCAPDADGRPKWRLGETADPVPYLAYSGASGLGRILNARRDWDEAKTATTLTSHLAATLMTMARDGHGVAWLPRTLAADDLASGRLMMAGPDHYNAPVEIRLFRSLDCRNKASDALWDHLSAR